MESDITAESLNSAVTASPTNGEAPREIEENVGNASELEQTWKSEDENEVICFTFAFTYRFV